MLTFIGKNYQCSVAHYCIRLLFSSTKKEAVKKPKTGLSNATFLLYASFIRKFKQHPYYAAI